MNRYCLAASVAACICYSVALAQQLDLTALKTHYESNVAAIEVSTSQAQFQLLAAYADALDDLRTKAQAAGELETLKALLAEISRIQTDHALPSPVPDLPDVLALVANFQQRQEQLRHDHARKMLTLAAQYDKALDSLKRTLTQEGKLEHATEVQDERSSLPETPAVVSARALLLSTRTTSQATVSGTPRTVSEPVIRPPRQLKGKFFVSVDDVAVVFVNGREVHRGTIGETSSSETILELGDSITINLINAIGPHQFAVAFVTTDGRYVVNVHQEDCRLLDDTRRRRTTQTEFRKLTQQPTKELRQTAVPFPFSTTSDWLWGFGNNCWLTMILTDAMLAVQEP